MTWFFRASLDSDPDFTIGSHFGKRKSIGMKRFIGKLVIKQHEPMTIQGWKRPPDVEVWSVGLEDEPDVTIRIARAD